MCKELIVVPDPSSNILRLTLLVFSVTTTADFSALLSPMLYPLIMYIVVLYIVIFVGKRYDSPPARDNIVSFYDC